MREQITQPPLHDAALPQDFLGAQQEELTDLDSTEGLSKDAVGLYLQDIGKYPLLTASQEIELAKTMEAGTTAEILLALRDPEISQEARESLMDSLVQKNNKMRQEGKGRPAFDDSVSTLKARQDTLRSWESRAAAITEEEAAELQTLVEMGQQAKTTFINCNLRLAVSVAKRYSKSKLPFLDRVQEANTGIIRAVEKFDYTQGYKFSTYATWWVKQAITRAIANTEDAIRLPVHVHDEANKLARIEATFLSDMGRKPTDDELADALGMTIKKVKLIKDVRRQPMSLNQPLDKGDAFSSELQDILSDPEEPGVHDQVMAELRIGEVRDSLRYLDEREQVVLRMRFGLDDGKEHTLSEVGAAIGLTRERVRQIQVKALAQLRSHESMGYIALGDQYVE